MTDRHVDHLPVVAALPSPTRQTQLATRIRWLVAATITYNVIEAIIAISAGTIASSTALIGFGLDSVIEVSSAAAVAWQFAATDHARREKTALRIIAVSFFALAAYVTVESGRALLGTERPEHSTVGLVLAALSLLIMPVLSAAQRRTGRELGSTSAVADSKQTLLCTYLSAVLLVGLGLNSLFGWWWADPAAALVIAAVAIKEGRDAWRGDTCCAIPANPAAHTTTRTHAAANPAVPAAPQGPLVIFQPMPAPVRDAFTAELDAARTAPDTAGFWRAAERAHILSQPWPWPHTKAHATMLRRALQEHDRTEALGQLIRLLVAGPGSALGRYPEGNTGRARVKLTQPMPVPGDLATILDNTRT